MIAPKFCTRTSILLPLRTCRVVFVAGELQAQATTTPQQLGRPIGGPLVRARRRAHGLC